MASDEVCRSVGEMVMMKTEDEGDPDDPNKNQVILQLQPITPGNECEAETDAAVMTVEAHAEATALDGEDVEICYPITCGDSKALLLAKKFVCPGINVKCVKYEEQLISPKQFVHMSGKATLKDWKRAIRMGGVMLRKMMDSGQLDFYHHSSLCTNTCRSTKFDLLINNTRFPPDGSGLTTPTSSQVVLGNGGQTDGQTDVGTMEWSSTAPLEAAEKKDNCDISEETLNFWKGIADVGLMGEVVTNISTELLQLLTGVQLRTEQSAGQDSAADSCLVEVAVLSNLAQVFGLLDSVKKILERRKLQINPGQEHVLNTLTNLEEQLEEQKRQQEVRALLSSPQPAVKNKPPAKRQTKRPRLQRPASTTTLLTSSSSSGGQQAALQQQQFTVLSPISLSSMGQSFTSMGQSFTSMGQSFTVAGLPLGQGSNTVTLLPAGSQVFTRYMVTGADGKTDTITLHPSSGLTLVDPSQLGAMMGPMELVQLTQQTGGADELPVEGQVMDGTVLVHQEVMEGQVEAGQEHTVIQIDPAPMGGGGGVEEEMVLHQDGVEMTVVAEASAGGGPGEEVHEGQEDQEEEAHGQEVQEEQMHTEEEVQGLTLDASGQLSNVQIVVMEESSQREGDDGGEEDNRS